MIIKNIFDTCPLQELQELLTLKQQQQATILKFLNYVSPSTVVIEFYHGDNVEHISFDNKNFIPPEFKNFLANIGDRIAGEIWILKDVIEEKTKLN